ncbi:hypothetical protein GCM10010300_83670 [Streptomyces olivaceoviridis]|nr:hypothetical protein GCM10010300_83670 [Streptomyces olivaceoviridis]
MDTWNRPVWTVRPGMCARPRWFPWNTHPVRPVGAARAGGYGRSNASMGEALERTDSADEPSRLRRVRLPGTVASPSSAVPRRPRDEETQEASGQDAARQAVE